MNIRNRVELGQAERDELNTLLMAASMPLASSNEPKSCSQPMRGVVGEEIARVVAVGGSTVHRTKRRSWKELCNVP